MISTNAVQHAEGVVKPVNKPAKMVSSVKMDAVGPIDLKLRAATSKSVHSLKNVPISVNVA